MLHREDGNGLVVITQPTHAWVAGQLARSWGNDRFGRVEPWEEVCLGAEQHDNGWVTWEAAPTLNPQTGKPASFVELDRLTHLGIWANAGQWALTFGRYPALLVSLHGAGLYERYYDPAGDPPEIGRAVAAFVEREQRFQESLLATLRTDPRYAPFARPEVVARNRRLVAVWDGISLAICQGVRSARSIADVPTAAGATALTLAPLAADPTHLTMAPWPFAGERVSLVFEGRRLDGTFDDEAAMRTALATAPWVTITTRLSPA